MAWSDMFLRLQILGWDERRGEYDSTAHDMQTHPFLLVESLHPMLALCRKLHYTSTLTQVNIIINIIYP